jgi:hypothetical protein
VAGIFLFGFEDAPLHVRPGPLSRAVAGAGLGLLYLTFVQGMRVTWRRAPFTALGIGAAAAFFMLGNVAMGGGEAWNGVAVFVISALLLVGAPLGLEYRSAARAPSSAPRRLVLWKIGATALLCLVLAWPVVRVWQARSQVTNLCAGAVAGAPAAEHEAKARDSGLQVMSWQDPKPGRPAIISASGGLFFFRWFCVVEHVDGKVTATRTFILD